MGAVWVKEGGSGIKMAKGY